MGDPNHPEHGERTEWAGGPFDPAAFDLDEVNEAMAWLACATAVVVGVVWSRIGAAVTSNGDR
jgi:hypothetical protein